MFIRASFSKFWSPGVCSVKTVSNLTDSKVKQKKLIIHTGTKSSLRGTTQFTFKIERHFDRYNGHLRHRLLQFTDEVSLTR